MNDLRPKIDYLEPLARTRVLSALEVANVAHQGQLRKSGEPFIIHPVAVAAILAEMRMDRDCIIAGLLHDTVEDTPITLEELETLFGHDVRKIVEGETKLTKLAKKVHGDKAKADAHAADPTHPNITCDPIPIRHTSTNSRLPPWQKERQKREDEQQKQADNLRAMFMAMTEDVRVIIVKLADRLHNIRTLGHMSVEKQRKIAKETLEFFAPLAHRLGMRRIKSELEELSFKYLHPEEYHHLKYEVETMMARSKFQYYLENAQANVKEVLEQDRILYNMIRSVNVIGSTKELYSIYKRMQAGENLSSMLDIATLRVVVDLDPGVDSNQACYHVLGRIHTLWKPLPKRLKDYISFPKPNGYQSLHTTVLLGPKFDFFSMEIQIRTAEMHQIAEEGIAAELFQSGLGPKAYSLNQTDDEETGHDSEWRRRTMGWLLNIREYIEEFSSSKDLIDAVRKDLLGNRVFVFTPKGRIVDLPKDSTPVDVAYRIHSDVGNNMIGAKVNGRSVEFDYKLQNADVVKIISSPCSPGPSSEWIGYAKSRTARQKIRQFLRARDRGDMLGRGRRVLEDEARRSFEPIPSEAGLAELMPRLSAVVSASTGMKNVQTIDDLYMAIAKDSEENRQYPLERAVLSILRDRRHNALGAPRLTGPLLESPQDVQPATIQRTAKEDIGLVLAPCCHPIRGDDIKGVRLQDGDESVVLIHRTRCQHLREYEECSEKSRDLVDMRWAVRPREMEDVLLDTDVASDLINSEVRQRAQMASNDSKDNRIANQPARFLTLARDCTGLLSYVSGVVASLGTSIRRCVTLTNPETMIATFAFEVLVRDTYHIRQILERIEECDEVDSAMRLGPSESQMYFQDDAHLSCTGEGGSSENEVSLRLVQYGQRVTWNDLEMEDS